jgi:SAM-dependent methyltransferase
MYHENPLEALATEQSFPPEVGLGAADGSTKGSYNQLLRRDLISILKERAEKKHLVRVLDIGCGKGRALRDMKDALATFPKRCHIKMNGVDRCFEDEHARIKQADIFHYGTGMRFDVITCVNMIQYQTYKLELFEKISNLLAPRGEAYIQCPDETLHFADNPDPGSAFVKEYVDRQGIQGLDVSSVAEGQRVFTIKQIYGRFFSLPFRCRGAYPVSTPPTTSLVSVYHERWGW